MGIRLLYREMVRDNGDLTFRNERDHVMGLLLSAQKRRSELENDFRAKERAREERRLARNEKKDDNKSTASKSKSSIEITRAPLPPKMAAAVHAYKPARPKNGNLKLTKKQQQQQQEDVKSHQVTPIKDKRPSPTSKPSEPVTKCENRWDKEERQRLNTLYWEIGRPRPNADKESMINLLKLYARRHRVIYRERTEKEVMERVRHMLRYNQFNERD